MKTINKTIIAAVLVLGGCGNLGNYSNDDVDFQLVVPEREDLAANLTSQQALVVGNPPEYLRITREVVFRFNALVDGLVGIVNAVRTLTPSERHGEVRIWGPFASDRDPRWELRMRLTRSRDATSATGHSFAYQIEYHRVGSGDTTWAALMTGNLIPGAGVRRGSGNITLDIATARAAGYPVGDFEKLDKLQVHYQRQVFPITVDMEIANTAASDSPGGSYKYSEAADGGGAMTFIWKTRENIWAQAIGIYSRWRPGGAGRADARVVEGLAAAINAVGIDCWAADGQASYQRRDFEQPKREEGDPASCVFGPAGP